MLVMWIPCFHCVVISGQAILVLEAIKLILSKQTDTYAAYFADGQNTLDTIFGLPRCEVFGQGYSDYLELYNVNTSSPVLHRGSFHNGPSDSTFLRWNYTAYPMLEKREMNAKHSLASTCAHDETIVARLCTNTAATCSAWINCNS